MNGYQLNHIRQLEAESIHIIREVAAEFKNPVMLYSVGKDSSVMLHLAKKAFQPGKIPFPMMHVDTGYKFKEMIEFRTKIQKEIGFNLIVQKNEEQEARELGPDDAHTDRYIYLKKTKPLLEGLKKNNFDAAFGGARREEEKARAKERIFSVRNEQSVWDPKNQRPELWNIYNSRLKDNESARIFPLSNWTEVDIWYYIKLENIEVVPLYFAKKRQVVMRNDVYYRIDDYVQPKADEEVHELTCRYRTLGCSPSTGAIKSEATSLDDIITEVLLSKRSERETRAIDQGSESAMENKKKEGYF
jgi:sulfate adenylyltransferase subunit 2